MYKTILKQLARLIGVAIFLYILSGINLENLISSVTSIRLEFTLVLLLLLIPIVLIRAVRWKTIAEGLNLYLCTREAAAALCMASLANMIIPGSFGDLVRIPYMKYKGNRVDKSIISILVDAFLGAIVPFFAGMLAIIYILEISVTLELILVIFAWSVGGYIVYRIIKSTLWHRFTQARLQRLMNEGIRGNIVFTFPSMFKSIGRSKILGSVGFSIVLFFLSVTQAYILAIALSISIDWLFLAISLSLASFLASAPITIQGLGIREGVLIFMLAPLGIENAVIISFSLIFMLLNIVPAVVGLAIWIRNPFIKLSHRKDEVDSPPVLDFEIHFIDKEEE